MSDIIETKGGKVSQWWVGLLTPQTVAYILAGFGALIVFWNTQKNTTNDVGVIKTMLPSKVDIADFKALEDRVTRQYETNNKILERIIALEKGQEYQRGLHDAAKENNLLTKTK